jgi:3-hydroxybutyryl-CoA dehydrogenase
MGAGIAEVAAAAGHEVLMADVARDVVEKAKAGIAQRLRRAVEKGKTDRATADGILERIQPVAALADLREVSIAIEAVAENLELKLRLFSDLDTATPPDAILASNTSSISITRIAAATKRPERVIGMYFMNPVPVMKLVELIRGFANQ